jgi:hypothetical protein
MSTDSRKPIVTFGLKENDPILEGMATHSIIFTCIDPGVIISMDTDIFLAFRKFSSIEQAEIEKHRFQITPWEEQQAKRSGDATVRLIHLLNKTDGLNWLYVLPTGLVSLIWPESLKYAQNIIKKMQLSLTAICGELDFIEVPGRELWIPTTKQIANSRKLGVLLPI